MATKPTTTARFREGLTYKLGPLPAWAWGVMLGVAILGYQGWRRRLDEPEGEGGDDAMQPTGAVGSSEIVTGTATGYGDFMLSPSPMGGGSWATAPLVATPPQADTMTTNTEWRTQATSWLIASNYTPTLAADAVTKYLDGLPVNTQEKAAVNAVLASLGPPPQGAPSILDAPAPPPQPEAPVTVLNPPGAVRNLRTGTIDANGIRVGWDVPDTDGGAAIFQYVTEREAEGTPGAWTSVNTPATSVLHPVPQGSGRWRIRVAAQNSRGIGPWTVTSWVTAYTDPATPEPATPPQAPPPAAPADPAPTIATVTSSGSDSTLWNMVRRVYGRNPTTRAINQIATLNGLRMVGSGVNAYPTPWRAGQKVTLPPASEITW